MRKVIAVLLALIQIAFAGFLVHRGNGIDEAERKLIDEIETNGTRYLFRIEYFAYDSGGEKPLLTVNLKAENDDGYDFHYPLDGTWYSEIITSDNGVSVLGLPQETVPDGEYVYPDANRFLYDLNYDSLQALFENEEKSYYSSFWSRTGKFNIQGKYQNVFAVGSVYNGRLVITGLKIGDTVY